MNIDSLLHPRWIIPVTDGDPILEHHSLAIRGGRIEEILPSDEARGKFQPEHEQELPDHALIPGLVRH